MEFRANQAADHLNSEVASYFTKNLSDPAAGLKLLSDIKARLGNAVESLPDWHPILTAPPARTRTHWHASSYSLLPIYDQCDHTREFVRGMLTCPYSDADADKLVEAVNQVQGLAAERFDEPLYTDDAFPVLIEALEVELEADGTIRSRDALAWFVQANVEHAREVKVADTWWNIRHLTLGEPHGARSSLLVNDYTGRHMRKILEVLNDSGMFGPIKEMSLDMLSERKRSEIARTLMRAALDAIAPLDSVTNETREFNFELRGETCNMRIRDTWGDGTEYSIRVSIGESDLSVSGFYYPKGDKLEHTDPTGKRKLAEKFVAA